MRENWDEGREAFAYSGKGICNVIIFMFVLKIHLS
jgi:hypothetical protein